MRIVCIIFLSVAACLADPPEVCIAWDRPTPEEAELISGYRAYWGEESGAYTGSAMLAPSDGHAAKVGGFVIGRTYFMVITAVGKYGVESPPSNEISFTIRATPQAPSGLRTVTVTMETSQNMKDWEPLASVSRGVVDQEFFRLKIEDTRLAQ